MTPNKKLNQYLFAMAMNPIARKTTSMILNVIFFSRSTIHENDDTYWINVSAQRIYKKGFVPIELDSCGKTKGCVR